MRLYLLPISTRRTLLYAQRLSVTTKPSHEQSYVDKAVNLAARQWSKWEQKESGWQRRVVDYGNHALRRIPYEEWGLKSVPPLSARRRDDELRGKEKVQLSFPQSVVPLHKAEGILKTLATERQALHRKRLIYCVLCMPLTIPVGLIPLYVIGPFDPCLLRVVLTEIRVEYQTFRSFTYYIGRGRIGGLSSEGSMYSGSFRTGSYRKPPRRLLTSYTSPRRCHWTMRRRHPRRSCCQRSRCRALPISSRCQS